MRFLIGKFSHESNIFSPRTTGESEFRKWELNWGDDVLAYHRGKRTVVGGFIQGLTRAGHSVVGSVAATTAPSGPVQLDFYRRVKSDLLAAAGNSGPLDGTLLSLHGAMSLEREAPILDPEGDLVSALRQVLGPQIPILAVFDLHSDTTDLLLENSDVTLAFNEEPHRDGFDRGLEAARLVLQIRKGEIHPTAARQRAPMLLPAINMATDQGPMHDLHKLRAELEATPGVLDISLHPGFYGADQPEVGFSVVCTTDDDPAAAKRLARRMAEAAWRRRQEFIIPLTPIDLAVERAIALPGPVGLIDEADDPAGGASADSVALLRGMLAGGVRSGGVSTVKDPEVLQGMIAAGEGGSIRAALGAKTDSLHGDPLEVEGVVRIIHRGPIPVDSWSGRLFDLGAMGVLDVAGVLVVVTENKLVTENLDIFEILGFDVREMQAVAFKGLGLHIRQALGRKIEKFIPVDGVGITHPDVRKLGPYRHVRRPIWPLDNLPLDAYPDWK